MTNEEKEIHLAAYRPQYRYAERVRIEMEEIDVRIQILKAKLEMQEEAYNLKMWGKEGPPPYMVGRR